MEYTLLPPSFSSYLLNAAKSVGEKKYFIFRIFQNISEFSLHCCVEKELSGVNLVLMGAEMVDQNGPGCSEFFRHLASLQMPDKDLILEKEVSRFCLTQVK